MISPQNWPVCVTMDKTGATCSTPYILRLVSVIRDDGRIDPVWSWQSDCKHRHNQRNHHVEFHDALGRVAT